MTQQLHETGKQITERVLLVGLMTAGTLRTEYEVTMEELAALSDTAGVEVLGRFVQNLPRPNAATYIGKGKLHEIMTEIERVHATTLIFNDELTPAQARNIAQTTHCNVVDRTELILDIFARHANTGQARMQVELAQLIYNYSRLRNMWKHFTRIEGGIGFKGPGETQIELDRREIRKRITLLRERIADRDRITVTKRSKRSEYLSVAIVGYTNAGKSTLFNRLTAENAYTADQLFATLDATSRALRLGSGEPVILTDTIGFIRKLPHALISSFQSTLSEVTESDLLLHVVDISQPMILETIKSVENVLKEIGCDQKNTLMVFNQCDRLPGLQGTFLRKKFATEYPDSVFVSALKDPNLDSVLEKIREFTIKRQQVKVLRIPAHMSNLLGYLHRQAEILERDYDPESNEHVYTLRAPYEILRSIDRQIEKEYFRCLPDDYRHAQPRHPARRSVSVADETTKKNDSTE